ncbi:MAG: hypothetical protein JRD39_07565 [Deltaproteobacteria bacterium]|jgi:hypothetical protein|nr:hypothetical protein [Deltaproteobacteria bacterium]
MESPELFIGLWHVLGWPLLRLVFFISLGLMIGNLIESLNWTHGVARLASPLVRVAHLSNVTGASFSMAFFSGITANTMLSEAYDQGRITKRELVFANLFNSLPTYFLHLPTLFFLAAPLIKEQALVYVGLTLLAAFLRTACILLVGRLMLPVSTDLCVTCRLAENRVESLAQALGKAWARFRQRFRRIVLITVPIYTAVFILNRFGMFALLEEWLAGHVRFLTWLHPESLGVVALQLTAEISAGLAAAGALLDSGSLEARQVILALLAGNVLSSPMRAARHQFPFYAGIFQPRLAAELIAFNQTFRAGSIILVGFFYYFLTA